jgi:CSLREA domain-containing protein
MNTTGSRSNALKLRFSVVGIVAAFAVGLFALHAHNAHAVTPSVVTVNSTANTDDGICSGPPNAGTGNCTLREAIYAVNAGQADTIKFHPAAFSKTTPGVINLESGFGDLPTIVREVTIDGTGAGVIIDGDGGGTGDPADNGTPCSGANLASGLDAHGNPALPCDNGIEVNATHNNFAFSLLGNGNSFFVIQHISDGGTGSAQWGSGQGVWLCGGDTTTTSAPDCTDHSFGTVRIDGTDIRDTGGHAIEMDASNLVDVMVTNNTLAPTGGAADAFHSFVDGSLASNPCGFTQPTPTPFSTAAPTITPSPNCLDHNSVTLDHNILNSMNSDAVNMFFFGNKGANSSINVIVTNNTFKSDNRSIAITARADYAVHGTYNIDINHNSSMHASTSDAIDVTLLAGLVFADNVNSTINISDNGNISGGIVSTAGAAGEGTAAGPSSAEAIDVFASIQSGDSHSTQSVTVDRNGNLTATGIAVDASSEVCCGSGNTSTVEVKGNGHIKSLNDTAVNLDSGATDNNVTGVGDHNNSTITLSDSLSIDGQGGDGVAISSKAGNNPDEGTGSSSESASHVTVHNNGPVNGRDFGIHVTSQASAWDGAVDDNTATTDITGNGDITGDRDQGVKVETKAKQMDTGVSPGVEGNRNTATTTISDNGAIKSNSTGSDCPLTFPIPGAAATCSNNGADEAVQVNTEAGAASGTADGNTASTTVHGNGPVTAAGETALDLHSNATSGNRGGADDNTATIEVTNNADITGFGLGDGVAANALAGSECSEENLDACTFPADHNTATVKVNNNAKIKGYTEGEGVDIDAIAGTDLDVTLNPGTAAADHNNATIEVIGNGDISSTGNQGVDADPITGGWTVDSLDNHNMVTIKDNHSIVSQGSDGLLIQPHTCCDAADTNTILVQGNGDITGQGGSGINISGEMSGEIDGICCSVNTVTIKDNTGIIQGLDGNGIRYAVDGWDSTPTCDCFDDTNGNGFPDAIEHSVNDLIVSGNNISGSSMNGIFIASGAFDASMVSIPGVGKSIVSGNTINGNGENGVYLDTVQGLNIGPNNTISGNGFASDTKVHAGIQIVNTLADSWVTAPTPVYLPAGGNRITQNSIYNNHNAFTDALGIDLNPENPGAGTDGLRIGCRTKGNPIDPNNCIQAPVINLIAEGGIVGGTTCALCTVEVFVADPNPHDQPMTVGAIQHGEGKTYLASGTADSSGNYQVHLPCGLAAGDLTATSTNKVKDTSEFSENHPFLGTGVCATATSTASNTPVPPTATNTVVPPTPTLTPVPKACGDVNDDGHVNAVDAQLILQLSAGLITTLPNMPSADVNHSGAVNPVDAALILQVEAGLIPQSSLHCT